MIENLSQQKISEMIFDPKTMRDLVKVKQIQQSLDQLALNHENAADSFESNLELYKLIVNFYSLIDYSIITVKDINLNSESAKIFSVYASRSGI